MSQSATRHWAIAAIACSVGWLGGAAYADPPFVWARRDADAATMAIDARTCMYGAESLPGASSPPPVIVAGSNPIADALMRVIGGAINRAHAPSPETLDLRRRATAQCMHAAGYSAVPITADEQADFIATPPPYREQWTNDFFGRPDFPQRLAAAESGGDNQGELDAPP